MFYVTELFIENILSWTDMQWNYIQREPKTYLGSKHESLPYHQRREDDHCKVE